MNRNVDSIPTNVLHQNNEYNAILIDNGTTSSTTAKITEVSPRKFVEGRNLYRHDASHSDIRIRRSLLGNPRHVEKTLSYMQDGSVDCYARPIGQRTRRRGRRRSAQEVPLIPSSTVQWQQQQQYNIDQWPDLSTEVMSIELQRPSKEASQNSSTASSSIHAMPFLDNLQNDPTERR